VLWKTVDKWCEGLRDWVWKTIWVWSIKTSIEKTKQKTMRKVISEVETQNYTQTTQMSCSYSKISQSSANSDIIKWFFAALSWHHKLSEWVCSVWVKKLKYKYQNFILFLFCESVGGGCYRERKSEQWAFVTESLTYMSSSSYPSCAWQKTSGERTSCIVTWTLEKRREIEKRESLV